MILGEIRVKKFAFALDKVLSYKRQYENSIRNEHAAIMHEIRQQEKMFQELSNKDVEIRQQMKREQEEGCQILRIHTYENYLEYLKGEMFRVNQRIKALKVREEKKRKELIAAKTDTTSLDKLKEKKLEEYNKEVQKEQEQLVEEFVNHGLIVAR